MAPTAKVGTVGAVSAPDPEPTLDEIVARRRARMATVADALRHLPPPCVVTWSASRLNPGLRYAYQGVSPILFVTGFPRPVVLSMYSQPANPDHDPFTICAPYDRTVHAVWSAALQRTLVEQVTGLDAPLDGLGTALFASALEHPRTKHVTFPAWSIDTVTAHTQAWVTAAAGRGDVQVLWDTPAQAVVVGTRANTYELDGAKVTSVEFDAMLRNLLDSEGAA